MAFAIVGPAGELVYFEKMDGAQLAAVESAQGKARTSVMFRRPSKAFADQHAAGNTAFTTFPDRPVASEGGLPIVVNGRIVGAIGASGGTGQQNGVAAGAGAAARALVRRCRSLDKSEFSPGRLHAAERPRRRHTIIRERPLRPSRDSATYNDGTFPAPKLFPVIAIRLLQPWTGHAPATAYRPSSPPR